MRRLQVENEPETHAAGDFGRESDSSRQLERDPTLHPKFKPQISTTLRGLGLALIGRLMPDLVLSLPFKHRQAPLI